MLRSALIVGVIATGLAAAGAAAPVDAVKGGLGHWLAAHPKVQRLVSGEFGRLLVLRSDLNVTDEQRAEIRKVVGSHRGEIVATVKSVRSKRVALRDAVLGGKDEAAIRAAAGEFSQAIADASVKAGKLRNELAPIMSEEQRQMIKKFFADSDRSADNFLGQVSKEQ
jgi:Spy/CpxP family protein refolding chaperone